MAVPVGPHDSAKSKEIINFLSENRLVCPLTDFLFQKQPQVFDICSLKELLGGLQGPKKIRTFKCGVAELNEVAVRTNALSFFMAADFFTAIFKDARNKNAFRTFSRA